MRKLHYLPYHPRTQGSVFLLSIIVLTVLLLLGASLIERSQTAVYRAAIETRATKSFHLAEAGVHKALWSLNQPNGWLTYAGESAAALPGGRVDIAVTPDPSTRGILTEQVTLVATGYLPGPDGAQRHPCTIRVITHKDPRYFSYAVFGSDKVTIGNGSVNVKADSYNSDKGSYGGGNVTANADIGTNSTAADAVEILPQGEVHGNVVVGAGANDPNLCVSNNGLITGSISALDAPRMLPPVNSVPADAIPLGDIWLDHNQELVLNEGTYHMTDLEVFGNARVTCNGKVVIYIDQTTDAGSPDVRIGGNGIVNTSGVPANLVLYCTEDVVDIAISGNGTFYGGIYAPNAHVALNSGAVHGGLVGRSVALNGLNAHVHYDEALRDHANPRAVMHSWEVL